MIGIPRRVATMTIATIAMNPNKARQATNAIGSKPAS